MALSTSRHQQSGAYLLEALVGILIFTLGVLGIVGLQALALKSTSDDAIRAEAVLAANQLIGQMWGDDEAQLDVLYGSNLGVGQPYKDYVQRITNAFGGAYDPAKPPIVNFPGGTQWSTKSQKVDMVIYWKTCSAPGACDDHSYQTSAVIGTN
jgi:type IV pilus assembly protein PilV